MGETTTTGDESELVARARQGDHDAFETLVEPIRRQLHLLCYRMLGSFHDAEDVLQDTLVKAWNNLSRYDGRASFRTWVFRIATNASLDVLRAQRRRVLPQDLGPARDATQGLGDQRPDLPWLEPYPDGFVPSLTPETAVELKESVGLAFVRALQVLPPRQRAVLILRDVLDWSAEEVAKTLETSVASVNSALQRARARAAIRDATAEPRATEAQRAEMASRYVDAWEAGDIDAIVSMLTADAIHAMPPWAAWFVGRDTLRAVYSGYPIWSGRPGPGVFRILPTSLNGELAFAEYCRDRPDGTFQALAFTIARFDPTGTAIAEKVSFVDADLLVRAGFPRALD